MPRRRVVVPDIGSQDYPVVAAIVDGLPPTWKEWRRQRDADRDLAAAKGSVIADVPVRPEELAAWMKRKGRARITADDLLAWCGTAAGKGIRQRNRTRRINLIAS